VDEHTRFLQEACESNISIKVVVGELTSDSEMWQVSEIISSIDASLPLFLQPVTLPDGCIGISAGHTFHLQELALSRLRDVRVIPQMHKMLGVF
jgi:organic radical activating enzyme